MKSTAIRFSDEDRLFTPTDPAGFRSVPPVRQAPTVVGGSAPVAQVGQGGAILVYPGGYDIGAFASAAPQLAIGSVMGTRAVVRWLSYRLSVDDLVDRISFFGIGAQHSISQYFRAAPVDLALGVFYQTLRANASLVDARAFHADITGSRSFSVLQPYAALGFDSFKMDVVWPALTCGRAKCPGRGGRGRGMSRGV